MQLELQEKAQHSCLLVSCKPHFTSCWLYWRQSTGTIAQGTGQAWSISATGNAQNNSPLRFFPTRLRFGGEWRGYFVLWNDLIPPHLEENALCPTTQPEHFALATTSSWSISNSCQPQDTQPIDWGWLLQLRIWASSRFILGFGTDTPRLIPHTSTFILSSFSPIPPAVIHPSERILQQSRQSRCSLSIWQKGEQIGTPWRVTHYQQIVLSDDCFITTHPALPSVCRLEQKFTARGWQKRKIRQTALPLASSPRTEKTELSKKGMCNRPREPWVIN